MATNHRYSPGCGVCLGVFHIIFGLSSLGCGIASVVLWAYLSEIALGIWAGVLFYGMTGILAFASSGRRNSVISAYYTFALLSVFVAMAQMGLYVWAVISEVWLCGDSAYWYFYGSCPFGQVQHLILHGVLVITAFLEWIVAMVSCCAACSCCCNSTVLPTQTVVIHTTDPMPVQMQQGYNGPAVMMAPAQAAYSGHPVEGAPAPTHGPTPQEYPSKTPLNASPNNPPAYYNPTFDQTVPADANSVPNNAGY